MADNKSKYYIYIILCEDNSYYTGITNNLINRFNKHKKGKGANYTKFRKPLKFLSAWEVDNVNIALSIEHYIKSNNKKTKMLFVENNRLLKTYYVKEMKNKKNYKDKIKVRSISKKYINIINNNL
ncbi:GIY-YIG nuclease family protein [Brachyspira alvinipulli]|uniref:GIY-YIG nuclease family protein n=1 Tax=Brachyspira alvinipulli TaxID=84379 RepID=UPI0004899912|nr:GIY-YIG nuclease family protein [Brachyspira alvinipulli]